MGQLAAMTPNSNRGSNDCGSDCSNGENHCTAVQVPPAFLAY